MISKRADPTHPYIADDVGHSDKANDRPVVREINPSKMHLSLIWIQSSIPLWNRSNQLDIGIDTLDSAYFVIS